MTLWYLTPIDATSASDIELGTNETEARETLYEIGYQPVQIKALIHGKTVYGLDYGSSWHITYGSDA